MHYALCTMHHALCTMHYALCTMHYALCTMHYALCTMHYALCTMHCALCTMHHALCTEVVSLARSAWAVSQAWNLTRGFERVVRPYTMDQIGKRLMQQRLPPPPSHLAAAAAATGPEAAKRWGSQPTVEGLGLLGYRTIGFGGWRLRRI
jgi:hypothetical protein